MGEKKICGEKISYQIVTDHNQIKEIVALQERVWAHDVVTSLPQLVAAIHHGGVVIGAFDQGRIVGFCYGFPGYSNGEIFLFSHMMGIDLEYRDLGIGRQLKFEQRTWAIQYGYKTIRWTFDPLEARNAYLNLCKLGGYVDTYVESYYGIMSDPINKQLPTDRFVLEWDLQSSRVQKAATGEPIYHAAWLDIWVDSVDLIEWEYIPNNIYAKPKKLISVKEKVIQANENASRDLQFRIAVPNRIHDMKRAHIEQALQWRYAIRQTCQDAFQNGYKVVGMLRSDGPVHYYILQNHLSI